MEIRFTITLCFSAAVMIAGEAVAEPRQFCVTCTEPDQTYVCRVETPLANPNEKGLQLYCIIRTSKDGGHKTCAVTKTDIAQCAGPVRTYSFQAPVIPPKMRDAVQRLRKAREKAKEMDQPEKDRPRQKDGEPETLIDMTGRAVEASRQGIKNTGETISGTASATTGKVGEVARGAGKGVTRAARKVGSATRKTGAAVGSTAKTALDCIRSWFRDCGSSK